MKGRKTAIELTTDNTQMVHLNLECDSHPGDRGRFHRNVQGVPAATETGKVQRG